MFMSGTTVFYLTKTTELNVCMTYWKQEHFLKKKKNTI